jgi:hypothetical protein
MKKDDLLKLAEIARVEVDTHDFGNDVFILGVLPDMKYCWSPHRNLNQAFECVDGTDIIVDMEIVKIGSKGFAVYLYGPVVGGNSIPWPKLSVKGEGKTRAEAICKAVLKVGEEG